MARPGGFMRLLSHFATVGLLGSATLLAARAEAGNCDPSRVMVVLDRSSSMNNPLIGSGSDKTKWEIATEALVGVAGTADKGVIGEYQTNVEFALNLFPEKTVDCKAGG